MNRLCSCEVVLTQFVNNQLYHNTVFKDNFIVLWGGKLSHQTLVLKTVFSVHSITRIHHDVFLHIWMALMDGQTGRLQVLQQPYCTQELACYPKSVLYILKNYIPNSKHPNLTRLVGYILALSGFAIRSFFPNRLCSDLSHTGVFLWTYGGAKPVSPCGQPFIL